MSDQEKSISEFSQFVESVKAKIPIDWLYTNLTKEEFTKVDSRQRARISWREDKTPSLTFVPDKNLLTDFTEKLEGSDKNGRSYNVLDILQKCGGAVNFAHALQMACEIAKVEIPDKFKSKKNKEFGHLPYNIGPKLKEVWEACQVNIDHLIANPGKRPISIVKFFEDRNIPFEADFLKPMNLGIAPNYDIVFNILKGQGILRKGKDDKELNIYREELGNNALVYPLYNIDGALCGLRFRQLDKKDFAEWIPVGHTCFFNGQRFKYRPRGRRIMIVEGEMNLVAYGIALYRHAKKVGLDVVKTLEDSLPIMYATGSKINTTTIFKDQLSKVLYLQDHDISDLNEDIAPKDHPVLKTCAKVAKEINADDLTIADWEKLSYVKDKFDLEAYLKFNEYKLESISAIDSISIARYAVNAIKKYCGFIKNEDNRREVQIKYCLAVSEMLQYAQKEVFKEIVKKEFAISDNVEDNITSQHREVTVGPYSIDALGRIIQTVEDEYGNRKSFPVTNFYMRITEEISYFSHVNNSLEKFYMVEVIVNGKSVGQAEVESTDIVDNKKMQGFLATTASLTDLTYMDNKLRGKDFYIITSLMATIPVNTKRYVFSSLGRPFEEFCLTHFKTELFCLFPGVSVINGQIKYNDTFQVNLSGRNSIMDTLPFEFSILSEEDYKVALNTLWYTLRHVHDCNFIDSLLGLIYDSCCRELQPYGIVDNEHGFPIYLAGQSGAFKTTSAVMAMSLLGKFKSQNDLLNWNGTALSIEHQLIKVGTMTHCIDDMKIEDMASKEFTNFFQSIYGGATKTRMDTTATNMRGGHKLQCSIIITSESENENVAEAIAARMLTLRISRCSKEIADEREVHFRKMMELYNEETCYIDLMRGVTPRMIAWAHKRGHDPYAASMVKWKKVFSKVLEKHKNNAERPSDMVTRLVASFEQMCEFFKYEGVAPTTEIDAAFENFVNFWKKQIKNQITRIEKQSSTYKIIDLLCQLINSESIGTRVYSGGRWLEPKRIFNSYPICDVTYPEGKGRKILIISVLSIIKQMNMQIANNSQPIIQGKFIEDLKETGLIENIGGELIKYPIPDAKTGNINWNTANTMAIDYEKLMETYARIKE
jgi:ribosomal protein L22